MTPRFLLGGPSSGCGKTTVCCAILQALVNRGMKPMACKSGPDYIDPMFHSTVIGAKSSNLDLFLFSQETARGLLKKNAEGCDITVIEGAMGYYDGIGFGSMASAWDLARTTQTPAVLVLDARGMAVSAAAEAGGFLRFKADSKIAGVIFNQLSPALYPSMARAVREATGLPAFGYLPKLPECTVESRHLGLKTAGEIRDIREKMRRLAEAAEASIDLDGLLSLAATAPELTDQLPSYEPVTATRPVVAVAKDSAFCFYYRDSLDLLEEMGVKLISFSPLSDSALPEHCAGLYLGGGYPELYAKALSENVGLRGELQRRISGGLPTIAECGGFLYLVKSLEDEAGRAWPMVGLFEGRAHPTNRLQRFGYASMRAKKESLILAAGDSVPVHEFHYWDCPESGTDFYTQKPQSARGWDNAYGTDTLYAGFPHFHFRSNPECARRFAAACAKYQEEHYHL